MSYKNHFKVQLQDSMKNIGQSSNDRVRRIALATFERIVTVPPVDEGTFRANWLIGFNTLDRSFDLNLKLADVQATVSKAVAMINTGAVAGSVVFICNSVPYAVALEYGHSWQQAPGGIVEPTCKVMKAAIEAGII